MQAHIINFLVVAQAITVVLMVAESSGLYTCIQPCNLSMPGERPFFSNSSHFGAAILVALLEVPFKYCSVQVERKRKRKWEGRKRRAQLAEREVGKKGRQSTATDMLRSYRMVSATAAVRVTPAYA